MPFTLEVFTLLLLLFVLLIIYFKCFSSQTLPAVALQPLQQRTPAPPLVPVAHGKHFPRHFRVVLQLQARRLVQHWRRLGTTPVGLAYAVVFRSDATPAAISVHFYGDGVPWNARERGRGVPITALGQLLSQIPVRGRRVQQDYKQVLAVHHLERDVVRDKRFRRAVVHHRIPPLVLEHWHLFCTHVVRVDEGQDDQVVVRALTSK